MAWQERDKTKHEVYICLPYGEEDIVSYECIGAWHGTGKSGIIEADDDLAV